MIILTIRYEIRDIEIPKEIQNAMQKQVGAERNKRAKILESEGIKQAQINQAEGEAEALLIEAKAKVCSRKCKLQKIKYKNFGNKKFQYQNSYYRGVGLIRTMEIDKKSSESARSSELAQPCGF